MSLVAVGIRGDDCGVSSKGPVVLSHNMEGQSHQPVPIARFGQLSVSLYYSHSTHCASLSRDATIFWLVSRQPGKCTPPCTEFDAGEEGDGEGFDDEDHRDLVAF
jgi:hypothetical protein